LSDSGMRDHPLTPMTDANLVRVLQAQSRAKVGLVLREDVVRGPEAIRSRFAQLRNDGVRLAVVDAIENDDLIAIGAACADLPLVTAGSGVALGLPPVYAQRGWVQPTAQAAQLPAVGGAAAVLSGSCSRATNAQVQHWMTGGRPGFRIDPRRLAAGEPSAEQALAWALPQLAERAVLIYTTAEPGELHAILTELGAERAGYLVEQCLARIAQGLLEAGVRRLVVAGGETSGAVVQALGVNRLFIGAAIDPGVPWTQAEGRALLMALKSGNFGSIDFFSKALAQVR
jgi:uncharacterized protein YgbK (DUF1537 family)